MSFNPNSPGEGLSQFFDKIWGDVEGFVYIPVKENTPTDPRWEKKYFKWPAAKSMVIDTVLTQTAAGKEVYFSPVIWAKPEVKKEAIKGSRVLWADFDGSAPEWGPETLNDHATEAFGAVPGPPTVEVQSSTESHRHVYWVLDEFATDTDFIQDTNRAIAYSYGADTSGWDAEQILRPPFTTNHKRSMPVLVARFDETTYRQETFTSFRPVKELVRDSVDLSNLPNAVEVIAKYPWDTDTRQLLNKDGKEEFDRSGAMMRIAYYCAEKGMADAECYSVLLWLDDKWEKFKYRNDRNKRLLDLVNKAKQRYPHAVADPTFEGLTSGAAEQTVNEQLHWTGSELLTANLNIRWFYKGLLQDQGVAVIASAGGVGKTQLCFYLMQQVALARDFLGFRSTGKYKGGFLGLEMGPPRTASIWKTMCGAYEPHEIAEFGDNILISPIAQNLYLENELAQEWLKGYVETYNLDYIVIDSLGKVVKDLNSDSEIRKVFSVLQRLRKTVIVIHHTRKAQENNKKPRELGDIYGSQYITSEPDSVFTLWRDEVKGPLEFRMPKNRMAEETEMFQIKRVEHLQFQRVDGNDIEPDGFTKAAESVSSSEDGKPAESGFNVGFD